MTHTNKQQGFGIIEIIIIVIVAAVGFIAWRVYDSQQNNQQTQPQPQQTQQPAQEQPNNQRATYTNTQDGYSFTYAKEWREGTDAELRADWQFIKSPDYKGEMQGIGYLVLEGAAVHVEVRETTATSAQQAFDNMGFTRRVAFNIGNETVAGQQAVQFTVAYESSPILHTVFVKDGKQYDIMMYYGANVDVNDYIQEYRAMLASFKVL